MHSDFWEPPEKIIVLDPEFFRLGCVTLGLQSLMWADVPDSGLFQGGALGI